METRNGIGIEDAGGYLPGESIMGRISRRASAAGAGLISGLRTVGKAANLGAPGAATGMPLNSSAGAGRGIAPPGTPVAVNDAALVAPVSTAAAAAPVVPPPPVAAPAVAPGALPAVSPSGTSATPTGTSATPTTGNVTRIGNSYSGANVSGDITVNGKAPTGGIISAQNNLAAENLARAGGQTSGFGPAGAIRGGGTVSSLDTSAGYAQNLKELAAIDAAKAEQNANMQTQPQVFGSQAERDRNAWNASVKSSVGGLSGRARTAAEANATRLAEQRMQSETALRTTGMNNDTSLTTNSLTNQTTRRGQDQTAASQGAVAKLAQDKLALEAPGAKTEAEQKQLSLGLLKTMLDPKATPEQKAQATAQLQALTGKTQQAEFAYAPGGQIIDPQTGQLMTQPGVIFNKLTGQTTQQGAAPELPPGMTKQVGTANGKPVYEDANGKRYQ